MAVVFISPRQRQRVFFMGITAVVILFLIIISFGVFLSAPAEVSPVLVFNRPKVNIDMSVFGTDQFKNLHSVPDMQTLYSYKATDKNGKPKEGFKVDVSIDQAKTDLEAEGLTITELKEAEAGRTNPFSPYYQPVVTTK